ncbi:MAG: hypothetical protein MJ149_00080 [Clostridia bacterium]|nr:hypothetical protein [Clostridia bacterium]
MTEKELVNMYEFGKQRRARLLQACNQHTGKGKDTAEDKMKKVKFVVDYFLNRLNKDLIKQIDGTQEFKPFMYDYSFLDSKVAKKEFKKVEYAEGHIGQSWANVDIDRRNKQADIYPSTYALKMATCTMLAREMMRICLDLGIDAEVKNASAYFYDCYENEKDKVYLDNINLTRHYWIEIKLDGVIYKVDLAGALVAEDWNKNHPEFKIDIDKSFIFVDPQTANPFDKYKDVEFTQQTGYTV